MAGGMRTGGGRPLSERTRGAPAPASAPAPAPAPQRREVRHCWVAGRRARHPGLVLLWRRADAGWEALVAYVVDPADDDDLEGSTADRRFRLVQRWLPAAVLTPVRAPSDPP